LAASGRGGAGEADWGAIESADRSGDQAAGIVYAVAALLLATTEAAAEATSASDAAPGVSMSGPVRLAQNEEKKSDDDELLDEDEDELLDEDEEEKAAEPEKAEETRAAAAAHDALFAENRYPSATTCSICHPKHYKEWSVSQHAYAQLSPVYLALQNFINLQINGTQGDFCMRCHNQVGMNMGEKTMISNLRRHPTSREGITCIVCHRVEKAYNKVSGRVALVEGDLLQPVYGPQGNAELERVLDNRDQYRVVTEPDQPGRKIHTKVVKFEPISSSTFCGSCHDVTLLNGFRLEEAFSEYRDSPAAAKGITCQDCHMGKVQGIPSGYEEGPAAVVGDVPTKPRKLTNHFFAGPDYSIIHPGFFPHNVEAGRMATIEEWLLYDYKAGWGTDEFENNIPAGTVFPERWDSVDDRYDAREIIEYQLERLEWARSKRLEVLRNGYMLSDVVTKKADKSGIRFDVKVENITEGHNTPTGFTGERLVWLYVSVTDRDGKVIFESGDLDPNGDYRDRESSYVHNGELPLDDQLFTLQSRFLVQSVRGGERERVVTIPYSTTSLPFLRPTRLSLILTGESTVERNHRKGIEVGGHRWGRYSIDGDMLTGEGPYKARIQLMVAMAPANLLGIIQVVGFDYGISPRAAAAALIAGHEVLYEKNISFDFDK
jgi:nitrate/TMAO reductase-like tetraheme cytochrome c subunit